MKVPIFHITCKGIAFYCNHYPVFGEIMKSADYLMVDGTHPSDITPMICGNCGQHVSPSDLTPDAKHLSVH